MTKKAHQKIWHKKIEKMMPPKVMMAQQGKKASNQSQPDESNPKITFLQKFKEQIKKAL